jgi:hypothetical protein
VSAALVTQHAMGMRHIVIRGLSGSIIFLHITSSTTGFLKKNFIEHNMRVLIFSTAFVCNISDSRKNSARYHH